MKYAEDEEKRRERLEPPIPRRPTFPLAFGRALFLFPFYGSNLHAWINLALLALMELFFLRMIVMAAQQIM